jgi:hypothetical protein
MEENAMRTKFRWALLGATALAFAAAALPAAGADAISHDQLMQRIQSARTPEDHQYIALIYEEQASTELVAAEGHRRMGNFYKGVDPTGAGRATPANMAVHCNNLVEVYTRAAKEYSALAKLHREAAAAGR